MFKKKFSANYLNYLFVIFASLIILLWGKMVIAYNSPSHQNINSSSSIEQHHIAQGDLDKVEIKTTLLKNNIY